MANDGAGRSVLKWGCFGCLGCFGLLVALLLVAVGLGWLGARTAELEDAVLSRDLPSIDQSAPAQADGPAPPPGAPLVPGTLGPTAGRVVLDLAQAEFHLLPGEPGGQVRVEARYDKNAYELEETLERPPGDAWTYRVQFRRTRGGWVSGLRSLFGGISPKVTVRLPPDVPLDLDMNIRQGGAEIELGGLSLNSAKITVAQAGGAIAVSEPLRAPMRSFDLTARMGGMSVRSLGNASPAEVRVDCSMGGMELDLRGEWVQDAAIDLKTSMGGIQVHLPRDLPIRGVAGRGLREDVEPEVRLPTLTFSVDDDSSGEVEFD